MDSTTEVTPSTSPRFDRIVFLGTADVGKSTLIKVLVDGEYSNIYNPTKEDEYSVFNITVDKTRYGFELWDVAGYIHGSAGRDELIMSGLAFVFVFSVTDPSSFASLSSIVRQVSKLRWEFKDMPMIIIGTKTDQIQQRKVSIEEAKKFAGDWSIKYQEISVNEIKEVHDIMEAITRQIIAYRILRQNHPYKKPRCNIM
eukprot:TRINITY_DN10640_c0_g1_i1.p1 TRINITY_DN10640_c0_g1~~TRINITY_DN10640_c0_g1_i1.p1  ORF type:complete len:199 (+),score=2.24 TRINITY_DN10640_c0_g1_i1:39-635(+)